MKELLTGSLTAGAIIGLCADISERVGGIPGAVLFGIGLVTICACGLPLFTGRVGSSRWRDVPKLMLMLLFNLEGGLVMWKLLRPGNAYTLGIGCGCLMQIGVTMYRRGYAWVTLLCVCAFVAAGYKHCIAAAHTFPGLLDMIQIVAGNIIGAKLMWLGGVKSNAQNYAD